MKTIQFGAETVHALRRIDEFNGVKIAWAPCGSAREVSRCDVNEDESNTLPVTCKICLRSKWYRKETNAGNPNHLNDSDEH